MMSQQHGLLNPNHYNINGFLGTFCPKYHTAQSLRMLSCLEQPCSDDRKVHLGVARHDKVDDVALPYVEAAVV